MILTGWNDTHTQQFQKSMFKVVHSLSSTGLFTDTALAELLDQHPKEYLDVCTVEDHPVYEFKFRTGDVREVDGKTMIDAVKAGEIWMNLRKAMNLHPTYREVLKQMYSELAQLSNRKPFNPNGGILISSPAAKVPYHFDATETILWHVRGHKRIYLYPPTPEFLNDHDYEKLMYSETEDYLPYEVSMDKFAKIFDLHDDELLTWPLNAPHRVENMTYCVSVTTEYSTPESTLKNAVMYANAVLRTKFGLAPNWQNASPSEKFAKAVFGKIMRKAGALDNLKPIDQVSFKLSGDSPGDIQNVKPYRRNF